MTDLCVCTGGSCHLKGAYPVIQALEQLIVERELANEVTLRYSSCMDNCKNGVCVTVDGVRHTGVHPGNIEAFFDAHVRAALR